MRPLRSGTGQLVSYTLVDRPPNCGVQRGGLMPRVHNPCWHRRWLFGLSTASTALCERSGNMVVKASPWERCAHHEREPGIDDEPGPPKLAVAIQFYETAAR